MSPKNLIIAIILTVLFGSLLKASANEDRFSGIFVISDITVSNDAAYQRYRKAVRPVIESCGGTYVVRAGAKFVTDNSTTALLETWGGWNPDRIIVLHFDTVEQANACFNSPEYEAAYALREGGASGKSITVNAFRPDE
jgi:uncharacterized protein (DUF1330 family)